jgi:hypothetical protein
MSVIASHAGPLRTRCSPVACRSVACRSVDTARSPSVQRSRSSRAGGCCGCAPARIPELTCQSTRRLSRRQLSRPQESLADITFQRGVRRVSRRRQSADDHDGIRAQHGKPIAKRVPKSPLHPIAHGRASNRATHRETHPRRNAPWLVGRAATDMHDHRAGGRPAASSGLAEVRTVAHAIARRQHGSELSGAELGATLAPARRENGASRSCPHAQPEAVRLRAPAVVGLEGALAHENSIGARTAGRGKRQTHCPQKRDHTCTAHYVNRPHYVRRPGSVKPSTPREGGGAGPRRPATSGRIEVLDRAPVRAVENPLGE